jgi:hypothetical protein
MVRRSRIRVGGKKVSAEELRFRLDLDLIDATTWPVTLSLNSKAE